MNPENQLRRFNDRAEWNARLSPRADAFPARRRMSPWIVSFATVAAIAVVVAVVFASFGLSVQSLRPAHVPPALPTATSVATATPPVTPTVEPTRTAAVYSGPATCSNILDPATVTLLQQSGYVDVSTAYTQKMFTGPDTDMAKVLQYGGVVCAWALPGKSEALAYAFGLINATQSHDIRAHMNDDRTSALAKASSGTVDFYTYPGSAGSTGGGYAFGTGFWALAIDTGARISVLGEIATNAAAIGATPDTIAGKPARPATPAKAPYLTSEGLGDLRIGQKIPANSSMAIYSYLSYCKGDRWRPAKKYGEDGFTVLTRDRTPATPLVAIILFDDTIPTKSGIRVGDSLATLVATYPEFDLAGGNGGDMAAYVIKGTAGQVIFEVTTGRYDLGNGVVLKKDTVAAIALIPISEDVSKGYSVFGTDALSPCANA